MALVQPSVPSRAPSSVPADTPRSGVVHVNSRHTARYTVIGNHLAQHRGLSLLAIGLAVHIQSLPAGARIGIKFLAARFPESEHRIAGALRELERHGYLARTRERLPGGRVVTRTVSYNQPGTHPHPDTRPHPDARTSPATAPATDPDPAPTPAPLPAPAPGRALAEPVSEEPAPEPPGRAAHVPLPEPATPDLDRHRVAVALLADLYRHEPRLLLAERDVRRLAPAVAAWLERGAAPDAVRRTLTAHLPEGLRHPAALLAHRLTALLPPPLPVRPRRPDPLQTCEACDRAFRAPEPGRCRGCPPGPAEAA
ncbi:helix-turn-helix domain-containing protein [Streptomyces sp. NPDC005865]|uniref:helix-turn-helix domain-containing protein n=1 Tax=Streptomyces sp. NPDC005865 TaxID=3155453 RepID=UPI003407DB41